MKRFLTIAAGSVLLAFSSAVLADGQAVYEGGTSPTCASCHDRGTAGAPKLNTPSDWQDINLDAKTLVESTLAGKGAMPAYQGRVEREKIVSAIKYMISTVK